MIKLNVPYSEKDEAKALGAAWNWEEKFWYIPKGLSPKKFKRWLPDEAPTFNDGNTIELLAPVYLALASTNCWSCKTATPVFCLCARGVEDEDNEGCDDFAWLFVSLFNFKHCGDDLQQIIDQHAIGYTKDSSKQAGARYYMNHCKHCGAKLGDFFMHEEPGGAFFPMSKQEAQKITLHEIKKNLQEPILVSAQYSIVMPNLISSYSPKGKAIGGDHKEPQRGRKKGFFRRLFGK